ncbi:MAG: hypothetical protein GY839_09160 [candidate division Zixibacteria bacterium]|nr:hypothetical protein [candidate division Zixibacteria bacterium]
MSKLSQLSLIFLIYLSLSAEIKAQKLPLGSGRIFSWSGECQAELKYDDIKGAGQNRPRWIRSLYLSGSLNVPGIPPIDLKFKLSSLNQSIRQYFNRLSLHVSKSWIDLYLGDTYPDYSRYTLKSIPIRGGSIDLYRGRFRLAMVLGQTKKAIDGTDNNVPSFRQTMHGFKVGYGKKNSSRINFNYVKFNDDESSIDSSGTLKPVENALAGIDGVLKAFSGKFTIKAEISGSAYSRNLESAEIDISDKVPGLLKTFYTPRVSSQYGLAYYINPNLDLGNTKAGFSYSSIDPAFVSLGLAYNRNDIRKFACSFDQRLINNKFFLSVKYFKSRDNLNNQKRSTLNTNSGMANANIVFSRSMTLNLGFRIYTQNNDDIEYDYKVDNANRSFIIGITQRVKLLDLDHTITSNYSLGWYRDEKAAMSPGLNYDNHAFNLATNTRVNNSVNLITGWNRVQNFHHKGGNRSDRSAYSIGAIHRVFKSILTTKFLISYNTGRERATAIANSNRLSFSLRSNYRFKNTNAGIKIERKYYNEKTSPEEDYDEFVIYFSISQTFGK